MTKDEKLKIISDLKEEGLSFTQIADKLGENRTAVYRIYSENKENQTTNSINNLKPITMQKSNNNSKLAYHLRKMDLEHEKEIKQMEFDEQERKSEHELEKMKLQSKILQQQQDIEEMKLRKMEEKQKNEVLETVETNPEMIDEMISEINDETPYNEEETIVSIPKKLQNDFKIFSTNIKNYQNEEIGKKIAEQLFEQCTKIRKYFLEWIKANNFNPKEIIQTKILKSIYKYLQSIIDELDNRGFFGGSYITLEVPEDILDEMLELL